MGVKLKDCKAVESFRRCPECPDAYSMVSADQNRETVPATNLNTPECKINFYDSAINMSIHNEMEVAEKWEKIICEVIAK